MYSAILIDDDVWSLAGMRFLFPFTACGFQLEHDFSSAEEAIPFIHRYRPDLIITDICMIEQSGLDMIRECREKNVEAVFIIVSGHEKFSYAQEAIELGVIKYLLKPLKQEDAESALQAAYKLLAAKENERCQVTIFDLMYDYVRKHATKGLSLDMLVNEFHISKSYASELFQRHVGKSFTTIKNECRMEIARGLLRTTNQSIVQVAKQAGYEDERYFSRIFRKIHGVSPLQYRKNVIEKEKKRLYNHSKQKG